MPEDLRNLGKHFGDVSIDNLTIEQDLIGDIGGTPTWTGEHNFANPLTIGQHTHPRLLFDSDGGRNWRLMGSDPSFSIRDDTTEIDYLSILEGGPVSVENADLRLDTGQSIEDGDGNRRFDIGSGRTLIADESGNPAIALGTGDEYRYYADFNRPWTLFDLEGGNSAIKYQTSASSPGTLELTNARLDHPERRMTHANESNVYVFDDDDIGTIATDEERLKIEFNVNHYYGQTFLVHANFGGNWSTTSGIGWWYGIVGVNNTITVDEISSFRFEYDAGSDDGEVYFEKNDDDNLVMYFEGASASHGGWSRNVVRIVNLNRTNHSFEDIGVEAIPE